MTGRRSGLVCGAVALLSACGGGASVAPHEMISEGTGDEVVKTLGFVEGARWTYADPATQKQVTEERIEGTAQYAGHVLLRHVSETNLRLLEMVPEGQLFWGSTADGMTDPPLLLVSLPLRAGREWTTHSTARAMNLRCRVAAVETLETPAGRFLTARVEMTNLATLSVSQRWYADGVGLVQQMDGVSPPATTRMLFDYALPEATP